MNKNRVLEILTDKDVIVVYDNDGIVSDYHCTEEQMHMFHHGMWHVILWENVDFSQLAFYRKFDATI